MWIVILAIAAITQDKPPFTPAINWRPPISGQINAQYDCGNVVRFTLAFEAETARILSYSGSSGEATEEELAQWNQWLSSVGNVNFYTFSCIGDGERLTITGRHKIEDRRTSVSVYWLEDRMRRYKDPYASIE